MHIVFANVVKVSPRRSATLILLLAEAAKNGKQAYRPGDFGEILGIEMILRFRILIASLLLSTGAIAADPCPAGSPGTEWASTCFETDHTGRRVKSPYLKRLRFDRHGYATVMISEPRELVAVNRRGKVVVPGIVHTGDDDFPHAYGGIARFTIASHVPGATVRSRCGYFDSRSFRIVVPAEYDHCQAFADDEAIACKECESYCTGPECQDRLLIGGTGFILGLDGKVRGRRKLPDEKSACKQIDSSGTGSSRHPNTVPRCVINAENPFNQLK